MRLYIGGLGQGQYECAEAENPEAEIVADLHLWVRRMLLDGEPAEERVRAYLDGHPDAVIVCDEVGNGIVPVDAFEREYRERLGRILIETAARAERVVRVFCGIGQRIKEL